MPPADAAVSAPVGATPTTLYIHLLNFQEFPVNTQLPDPGFTERAGYALAAHTLSCLPNPPSGAAPFSDQHTWYGYSTPTYVEYDFEQDGHPRVNQIRGLSWNVSLDAASPVLHWFLAVRTSPAGPDLVPLPLPNVVIEATLRAPDPVSIDDNGFGTGQTIASGRSAPALLAGDATQGAEHSVVEGMHVYGFTVPLSLEAASIPGDVGYTLTVKASMDTPVCPVAGGSVMPAQAVPFADPQHLARIELTVKDPLRIDLLVPRSVNGTVDVHAVFNSVWGSYDIDEDNVTFTVEGPDGPVPSTLTDFVQRTHEWYHFTEPVRATWTLPDGLPAGLYWANLTVRNDQHTAEATARAAFQTGPFVAYPAREGGLAPVTTDPGAAMPSLGPGALVLALAVGAVAARKAGRS